MHKTTIEETLNLAKQVYETAVIENYPNKEDLFNIVCSLKNLLEKNKTINLRMPVKNRADLNTVAYFLSRFGHEDLFDMNQSKCIKKIAEILQTKYSTLKATRDKFDPYFNNGRKGWGEKILAAELQEVFDNYRNSEKEEILREIKIILKIV